VFVWCNRSIGLFYTVLWWGGVSMEEYTLKIELLTDAVFGSGNSVPGFVDADVLHDEYGFLYINGKL